MTKEEYIMTPYSPYVYDVTRRDWLKNQIKQYVDEKFFR